MEHVTSIHPDPLDTGLRVAACARCTCGWSSEMMPTSQQADLLAMVHREGVRVTIEDPVVSVRHIPQVQLRLKERPRREMSPKPIGSQYRIVEVVKDGEVVGQIHAKRVSYGWGGGGSTGSMTIVVDANIAEIESVTL